MTAVTKQEKAAKRAPGFASAREFREVLDETLSMLDSDERSGPRFRASGMNIRFELPDIGSVLDVAAGDGETHNLRWKFAPSDWAPKLQLRMDSDFANEFLQGRESLAIAVARGRVRVTGEPRFTLLYVPALRLLVEPYRRAVHALHPAMEMA